MKDNKFFHRWLLPMNGLQDRTPYAGRPVGNSPEFKPLDNSLNRDILHSLHFHCVFEPFFDIRGGKIQGGEEYELQLIYTKGNLQRSEAYMGIENGNPLFGS